MGKRSSKEVARVIGSQNTKNVMLRLLQGDDRQEKSANSLT
ncbi:hypothetical protein EV13_2439 [Prochlorococcus sp. MIT 0702]|nr:hypothetical protein EV13_2439 [Prochlorococcus sp. MIT 0702]KGG29364.1 hypothetical protein EV12_0146 [Prochlorococcus sp. MIT 0701]KGG33666.1 hypothetical protein EV14_1555 [Prochlorococcus sp. MIT 0703]